MDLTDLKRWHWCVFAILLGLGLSYSWLGVERDYGRKISQIEFERDLVRKHSDDRPFITGVVIHEPQEDFRGKPVQSVTGKRLLQRVSPDPARQTVEYVDFEFIAQMPYVPLTRAPQNRPENFTVKDYLEHIKSGPGYRAAWERNSVTATAIITGTSLVLIGGVWPSIIGLLTGAGLVTKKPKKEKKSDSLFHYKPSSSEDTGPAKPVVTAKDQEKLEDLNEMLEKSINSAGLELKEGAVATASAGVSNEPVKKLTGTAEEASKVAQVASDEPKEYTGEFYPVVKPHHHPDQKSH